CEVLFYDRTTRRETRIVSAMAKPPMPRQPYHLDPHPQFTPDGNYIAYTTFDRGAVDVALAPTAPLKATVA
ncbi:MAG TPA: hypothetical protein VK324_04170, partial [Tepidisphaeraceae bacterium]|nr:hypothetical protein [Tepidisphaeraceae bacterium]